MKLNKQIVKSKIRALFGRESDNARQALSDKCNQLEKSREVLRRLLAIKGEGEVLVKDEWGKKRLALRQYILNDDFAAFLHHPICQYMFFRMNWASGQDYEVARINSDLWGRKLLKRMADPVVGAPVMSSRLPRLSVNMLGMLYYVWRLKKALRSEQVGTLVEVGGGYGAFCYALCRATSVKSVVIIDLPEMHALQHYFLSQVLPDWEICVATDPHVELRPKRIILLPACFAHNTDCVGDVFFSTFGYSEMPHELQSVFATQDYYKAKLALIAGQLRGETPELGWVPHGEVVGVFMESFQYVCAERFHIGSNYWLEASRK